MPGENLTRAEAEERREIVDTTSYSIALDLTTGDKTFLSTTTVRFRATPGASTFLDAITHDITSIVLNGVELDVASVSDTSRIVLSSLQNDNVVTVTAHFAYTNSGEGLHRFVDPVDNEVYLYTQFEVPDSRRVFAVFEQPDLKATFQFTVTAPAHWKVVSNSPTPEPAPIEGSDNAIWVFDPTPRISSYITALIAGPYTVWRSSLTSSDGRTIPLGVFARASLASHVDADEIFDTTRRGFTYFEEKFRHPYPFAKYDQLFVPEFNAGAMENAGAVTFTESYVFRSKVTDAIKERRVVTILHELAHMWFGDLVTMTWWNDLWLNESFAEWASTIATAEATEWVNAWTTFQAMEKNWAYKQDQLPSTHPIVATINDLEDVQVNFDGITYAKGASVLKQLVAWVGQEAFFAGVAAYFDEHAYKNTRLADLLRHLEKTSGRDLARWSSLWLETAGVNTLRPEITTDENGAITSVIIHQTAPDNHPTLRPHRIAIGFYNHDGDQLIRRELFEVDIDGPSTTVTTLAGHQRPDLMLLNDDDLAYAKIRLDKQSADTAARSLSSVTNPLARSLLWGYLWDLTRDAEMPARDYIRVVLDHIEKESESTTLRTVLTALVLATTEYVAPGRRDQTRQLVATALLAYARKAPAGSDAQLQFVKFFAIAACTAEHFDVINDWREGSEKLEGLPIDVDLRWEFTVALAAGGVLDQHAIAHELENDKTATGEQFAAQARAALPNPADKQTAWSSVFDNDRASNLIVRNTGLGLRRTVDSDVLSPFVELYFSAINTIWERRSYSIAEALIRDFYPASLATDELRDATTRWLSDNPDAPPALRRIVRENRAGVDRALRAQEHDASH